MRTCTGPDNDGKTLAGEVDELGSRSVVVAVSPGKNRVSGVHNVVRNCHCTVISQPSPRLSPRFACWEASAKTPMELRLKSGCRFMRDLAFHPGVSVW